MKRIVAIFFFLMSTGKLCSAVDLLVPDAWKIRLGEYYEAKIEAPEIEAPFAVSLVKGKLPFGLRITSNGKIAGYPAAVEKTAATLRAESKSKSIETEISFSIIDDKFRLVYMELPVAVTGATAEYKIEGQGGQPPYGDCRVERVRTFRNGGAAKPGSKAPALDEAPSWLTLKSDCTLTAKPNEETEVFIVISAKDAAGTAAKEFYTLRSASDAASKGWLETKARQYDKDYQENFSPNGLTLEIESDGSYTSYGDSAMWTGTYLAGAAYYYAVTGEDTAKKNLDKALFATTRLREITGVPGLIARGYENEEWKGRRADHYIPDKPSENAYEVKDGIYKGWRFWSTASRDQFTGVLWGNATVLEILNDQDMKKRASENIYSMVSHVWDHKMKIVDLDGYPTQHGLMSGYTLAEGGKEYSDSYNSPMRISNGLNAVMLLNWFDLASYTAPDEKASEMWRQRYMNLISKEDNPEPGGSFEKNYLSLLKKVYVYGIYMNPYLKTDWFNVNLLFNNLFHLTRFEKNPKLREKYRDALDFYWKEKSEMKSGCDNYEKRRAEREKNPHFTWQYLAAKGDRDPDKLFDALSELMIFPKPQKTGFKIQDPIEIDRIPKQPGWSCEPVPIQYRFPEDFQWQRNPYRAANSNASFEADKMKRPGVDVVTPYWMGRYFGFVPSNI